MFSIDCSSLHNNTVVDLSWCFLKLDKGKLLNAHLLERLLLILTVMTKADIYELKQAKLIRN